MPIGAIVGGIATVGGAAISSGAAKKQSQAAQNTATAANAQDLAIFNQQREDLQPWRTSGATALAEINRRLGLSSGTGGSQPQPASARMVASGYAPSGYIEAKMGDDGTYYVPQSQNALAPAQQGPATQVAEDQYGGFTSSPGYQFRLDEGNRNLVAQRAATGTLASGDAAKALTRYGQDYASNEFNTQLNQLFSVAGLGQTAVGQGNALASNYGNNVNANNQAASNALQSSYGTQANAWQNALGTFGGFAMNKWG